MTKSQHRRMALAAIRRARALLASASHDYELGGYELEASMTYTVGDDVYRLLNRLQPKRRKKASA